MTIKRITVVLVVLCFLLITPIALGQSGNFNLNAWTFSNGGGLSSNSGFTVVGATGQFNAAAPASNGRFTVAGGFWGAPLQGPTTQNGNAVHLPLIVRADPITPPAIWQRLGGNGQNIAAVAIQGGQLFAGIQITKPGGLFKKSLPPCDATQPLARVDEVKGTTVLSILFKDGQGILANYGGLGEKLFYSRDGGVSWQPANDSIDYVQTVAIATKTIFYAGTLENGIYRSDDAGVGWTQQTTTPGKINALKLDARDPTSLWIATEEDGVWKMNVTINRPLQANNGLTGDSRKVWDFAFDQANSIYIATFNGVFRWDGSTTWEPFGLTGKKVISLEIAGNQLYAGARPVQDGGNDGGVWRRPLTGGDWAQVTSSGWKNSYKVRDLLYDPTFCKGLLAATDDGVWLYPSP